MDITLGARSQATGRFNFVIGADGDVSFDDTEAHAVMTSSIEHKGSYWLDRNHGSDLFTLKSLTSRTPSQATAFVLDGLNTLVQTAVIDAPTVSAKTTTQDNGLGQLKIDLTWSTPSGVQQQQTVGV